MWSIGRGLRAALTCGLIGLETGCAHLSETDPAPASDLALAAAPKVFRLEGRVSVKAGEESFSGGLIWRRDAAQEELLLRTPLGQGVAELRGGPEGMKLTDAKGRVHQASNADDLVHQTLGLELPLRGLVWWVVGHPRPGIPYRAKADPMGRLDALEQDGWRIEFSRYQARAGHALPGKLLARRGDALEVRLVVDTWELP